MTTTTVELTKPVGPDLSEARLDVYSSLMARLLSLWVVIVAVATFLTVPWLRHVNAGDMTLSMTWFYHALMLPSALLFLILCTRVFATHPWVRYVLSHSAPIAVLEGLGFLILGYGTEHHVSSLVSFGYWIIMPLTIELFAVTVLFVGDLAVSAFWPPSGERMRPQKAEIHWALFFAGISTLTWVVLGIAAAASVVGVSWSFWAQAQHESTSTLVGNIITSHSHGMLPSFMAGIVFLAAEAFGYSRLSGLRKQVARGGVGIMLGGIALYSGVYFVSALGTFVIPAWFPYGPGGVNGLAMDDTFTGLVGVGALIVAFDMLPEIRGSFQRATGAVRERFNPVRLGVYMTYIMAAAAMFLYGYYIENNENKFGFATTLSASRVVGDQVFTRAHLLLVFGSLPVIAVFLMAAELLGDTSGIRDSLKRLMSGIVLVGMVVATAGMGTWIFATPLHATTWSLTSAGAIMYMAGQSLILLGAVVELFTIRTPQAVEAEAAEPPKEMPPAHAAIPSSLGDGQHAEPASHGASL
ncbi:MAG: hypothetical protein ACYCXN_08125 [Acidimicrobiales bacterium]|jgi:hypothetical protein